MKRIKNFTLGILGATILSLGLYACSNDNETTAENSSTGNILASKMTTGFPLLKYGKFNYSFDGQIFKKHNLEGNLDYFLNIDSVDDFNIKEDKDGMTIISDTQEVVDIKYTKIDSESALANITVTSNGKTRFIKDLELINFPISQPEYEVKACPPCIVAIIIVIGDLLQDDFETNCRKSAQVLSKDCVSAGGKPNLTIESGGWFSSDKCNFSCN